MVDVQNQNDTRRIPLQKVGVRNISHPVTVLDRDHRTQHTVADLALYASLPHDYKGTHMSRFVEVFQRYAGEIRMPRFLDMLQEVRQYLDAERAFGELHFPYFMEKQAPVSRQPSLMNYRCGFSGSVSAQGRQFFVSVAVPVTTLCPCSREISSRGAHNQRGTCTVTAEVQDFFWMEDLIELIESCASAGLYTLLKRVDEKFVTEQAYDHPVFVEDLVREVTTAVEERFRFPWFCVEALNQESIHNHDAYAYVERGRPPLEKPHES
ncbi:GTP cyclohydrolase I [Alkalispirochaeta americana]|uniref:GTP cyclohydrolase FolE2 n=1 Tax=Alkalispirochaeta americana TaxID=159291 RepID=A0A1N6P479_9SPIO|nr:GTP cyclohydrolase FolE2 [Alkalispirochaeta americana]SIP99194.1 GTP cyclohydrolase I [Alkalispirochaeta americana]